MEGVGAVSFPGDIQSTKNVNSIIATLTGERERAEGAEKKRRNPQTAMVMPWPFDFTESSFDIVVSEKSFVPLADGVAIESRRSVEYYSLVASALESGRYYIFSCGCCGYPECDGIYDPVEVKVTDQHVYWTLRLPQPFRTFQFPKHQYRSAIFRGISEILRLYPEDPEICAIGYRGHDAKVLRSLLEKLKPQLVETVLKARATDPSINAIQISSFDPMTPALGQRSA